MDAKPGISFLQVGSILFVDYVDSVMIFPWDSTAIPGNISSQIP